MYNIKLPSYVDMIHHSVFKAGKVFVESTGRTDWSGWFAGPSLRGTAYVRRHVTTAIFYNNTNVKNMHLHDVIFLN